MMVMRHTLREDVMRRIPLSMIEREMLAKMHKEDVQCCCTHKLTEHNISFTWGQDECQIGLSATCTARPVSCKGMDCRCPAFETDNLEYLLLLKRNRRVKFPVVKLGSLAYNIP